MEYIWYILCNTFGIFYGIYLEYIWYIFWPFGNLVVLWYIFPRFGTLCQETLIIYIEWS
jgi:hypothetical protein